MFKHMSFSMFSVLFISAQSANPGMTRVVKVTNNSDSDVIVTQVVPAYHKAMIQVLLTPLHNPQDALHKAILEDSAQGVRDAVRNGANVNYINDGKTPMFYAVLLRKTNAVEALIECGAEVNETLVKCAIQLGEIKTILPVLRRGIAIPEHIGDLIIQQIGKNDIEGALLLLNCGISISDQSILNIVGYILMNCSTDLKLQILGSMFENGYKITDYQSLQNVHYIFNNADVTELFLKNGLPVDKPLMGGAKCLYWAAPSDIDTIKVILEAGALINERTNGQTILSTAVAQGNAAKIAFLIERGAHL